MTPAEHAATVREGIAGDLDDPTTYVQDAYAALDALVALAERATELERERDHWKQEAEGLASEQRVAEAAVERAVRAEKALRQADDLLRRLDEWDVMNSTHDGPYWKREIAAARAALGETAPQEDQRCENCRATRYDEPTEHVDERAGWKCSACHWWNWLGETAP